MLPAVILTIAALLYRLCYVLAGTPVAWVNFSPLAAIFLCTGIFFPRKLYVLLPLVGLFVSDLCLNAHYHAPLLDARMLPGYFAFGLTFVIGLWIRKQPSHPWLFALGGAIAGSLLFYWITNSVDWCLDPGTPIPVTPYPKTFAGYIQALTVGHPGFPPTILFLQNSLISNILYTALFLLAQSVALWRVPSLKHAKNHT
jgi:hypothetical protein